MKTEPSKEWTTHLSQHIEKWPATKEEIVSACNGMSHIPDDEKDFVVNNLPDGEYKDPEAVMAALGKAMGEEKKDEMGEM